jgi:hypothetical protein
LVAYGATRIGIGQVTVLVGLLVTLVSSLIVSRPTVPGFDWITTPILLNWTGCLVFLVGSVVMVSGVLEGGDRDPFDLFVIGLVIVAGGFGMFLAAGIAQWNPSVNPQWAGSGPKPEAALVAFYGSIQAAVGVVATLRSLAGILGETRRLTRV